MPDKDLITVLKQASDLKSEAWNLMRRHPLWKAIEDELRKTPDTALVDLPEGTTFLHWAYNGNGGACGSGVSLQEVTRAADGAWLKISVTFQTEDGDDIDRNYSFGVPDSLLENFSEKSFKVWLAERTTQSKDSARQRAEKILKQAKIKYKILK